MKKRQRIFLGIVVLMIAAIFVMAGCNFTGGNSIPVRIKAYNNNGTGPSSQSLSMNRAVGGEGGGIMPLAADTNFAIYTNLYSGLGEHLDDITPTKFVVGGGFSAYAEDGRIANIGQDGLFDFAQGLTIDVGDVTGGVTTAAIEMRVFSSLDSSWAEVEFPWPNSEAEFYNNENHYGESIALFNGFTPSWNAGKATTLFYHLEPRSANMSVLGKFDMGTLSRIIYGAGERRLYNMEGVPINSVIPGLDFLEDGFSELGNSNVTSIVIPFTPVHIPEDANSVTLNISWNLDGIISHYEGPTDDANDDVFVLKNGWWNGLYIDAIVN